MAQTRLRVAAGAGLVAASLTIVGPGVAVVAADPGGSGQGHSRADKDSGRGHDGDRHRRDRNSSGDGRQDRGNDQPRRGDDRGGKSNAGGSKAPDDTEDVQVASRSISSAASSNSLVAEQAPQAAPAEVPAAAFGGGGSAEVPAAAFGGGGSGGAAQPAVVGSTVTFGNGRTPGFLDGVDEPSVDAGQAPAQVNSAPAAVSPSPPGPEVMPLTTMLHEFDSQGLEFIDRIWAPLRPAFPGGLVFGIAGLLVAPLAGVWLGYRQAHAAEAADQLVDR
ncbi:MAG: hypothetical protein JWQ86_4801 [Mycobacterium sp.]|nr:hypothetical protein [Mycobacterium sp.]